MIAPANFARGHKADQLDITKISPRISLCIIYGNEEAVIERMLDSFEESFDELCAVRAIGNQAPDKSKEILIAWCFRHGKSVKDAEYSNGERGKDRWHVDNFGAARQMSFDLATSPWIIWGDCDDLLAPGSAVEIRKWATHGKDSCYGFPYIVSAMKTTNRERLIKKGAWKWMHPIHESMTQAGGHKDNVNLAYTGAAWIHSPGPGATRKEKADRNLWILENMMPEQWFPNYFAAIEYFNDQKVAPYRKYALRALADWEMPNPFRYELELNLSKLADTYEEKIKWALAAYKTNPGRREALGYLALMELDAGHAKDAFGYARAMNGLPESPPNLRDCNHEPPFYGWLGQQIINRTSRVYGAIIGTDDIAGKREADLFRKNNGKITLCHASRGRPFQSHIARQSWFMRAKNPAAIEHIYAVDDDDKEMLNMLAQQGFRHVIVPAGGGSVAAWNKAAQEALGDVVIAMSDDFLPPEAWDEEILKRIGDTSKPAVLAVSDGLRSPKDALMCLQIATKARIAQQDGGTLFYEGYKSVFSDDEFTVRAYADGVVIQARDLVFRHDHPLGQNIPPAQWDKTYRESNSEERMRHGMELFNRRNQGVCEKLKGHSAGDLIMPAIHPLPPPLPATRTHFFRNELRLGDCLWHCHWMRHAALRQRNDEFIFFCNRAHHSQLYELVIDLPNVKLYPLEMNHPEAVNCWINVSGKFPWAGGDVVTMLQEHYDGISKKCGFANPLQERADWLFDYAALDAPANDLVMMGTVLIVNSPPMSGQFNFDKAKMDALCAKLAAKNPIICTAEAGAAYQPDKLRSITDWGRIAKKCEHIVMVSTGPSWATFNAECEANLKERVILLGQGLKLNYGREWPHFDSVESAEKYLTEKGLI